MRDLEVKGYFLTPPALVPAWDLHLSLSLLCDVTVSVCIVCRRPSYLPSRNGKPSLRLSESRETPPLAMPDLVDSKF